MLGAVLITALAMPAMANPPEKAASASSSTGQGLGSVMRSFTRVAKAGMAMMLLAGDPLAQATASQGLQLPDACPVPAQDAAWGLHPVSRSAPDDQAGQAVAAPRAGLNLALADAEYDQVHSVVTEGTLKVKPWRAKGAGSKGAALTFRAPASADADGLLDYFDPATAFRFSGKVTETSMLAHHSNNFLYKLEYSGPSIDGDGARFRWTQESKLVNGWPTTVISLRIWGGTQDVALAPMALSSGSLGLEWEAPAEEQALS